MALPKFAAVLIKPNQLSPIYNRLGLALECLTRALKDPYLAFEGTTRDLEEVALEDLGDSNLIA